MVERRICNAEVSGSIPLGSTTMEETYIRIKNQAQDDPNILGFFLKGSRGKGRVTPNSDYDMLVVTKDAVAEEYQKNFEAEDLKGNDLSLYGIIEFRRYAAWGTEAVWDRYDFAHIKVEIDKLGGEIQKIVDEKGKIPEQEVGNLIRYHLDAYINGVFRSIKCTRDNDLFGARVEAAESINFFLILIFAFHGRLKPYGKYLEWELNRFPLEKIQVAPAELIKKINIILASADILTQQELLKMIERLARNNGYVNTIDGWEGKFDWMLKFTLSST